jgi:hypothetical protein
MAVPPSQPAGIPNQCEKGEAMSRRKKLSISMLLVEGIALVCMLKVFVWVIGNNVMKSPFSVPELDYALFGLGALLVLRVGYVVVKAKVSNKAAPIKPVGDNELELPSLDEHVCAHCGKAVSEKVWNYCKSNSHRFQGKVYCYDHQRSVK